MADFVKLSDTKTCILANGQNFGEFLCIGPKECEKKIFFGYLCVHNIAGITANAFWSLLRFFFFWLDI